MDEFEKTMVESVGLEQTNFEKDTADEHATLDDVLQLVTMLVELVLGGEE